METQRSHALRLALYLHCAEIVPRVTGRDCRRWVADLTAQFQTVAPELHERARTEGRRIIRDAHGLEKAACHLVPASHHSGPRPSRWRRSYERYRRKMQTWPPETPPCKSCGIRSLGNLAKRSFRSRQEAEVVCAVQGDPLLRAYPCPVQPGFWHLGHIRPNNHPGKEKT
jgi:hypothetical protein